MKFPVMINVLDEVLNYDEIKIKLNMKTPGYIPVNGQVRHLKPGLIRQSIITFPYRL